MTWRQSILALGLHTTEEMAEDGFEAYWLGSTSVIPDKGGLRDYWTGISLDRDFLGVAHSYTFIRDPVRILCHRIMGEGMENVLYLLAQYLFRHVEGRKSGAKMSRGYFIRRLIEHFGLVSDEGLMGLTMIACELMMIDLDELVRLNIYVRPEVAEGAPDVDKGAQAIPAPV
ncbi:hypothetical protein Tco_1289518 [Tanacetum coccineum]